MEINSQSVPGSSTLAVLDLNGELDASNYLDVIEHVRRLYTTGTRQLIIDLSDVSFLSSSGLVALHSAALVMRGDEPPSPDPVSYTHLVESNGAAHLLRPAH